MSFVNFDRPSSNVPGGDSAPCNPVSSSTHPGKMAMTSIPLFSGTDDLKAEVEKLKIALEKVF